MESNIDGQSVPLAQPTTTDTSSTDVNSNVWMQQAENNPEVVMFMAEIARMNAEGDALDSYYTMINSQNEDMEQMSALLTQLDDAEAECNGVNGTVTISPTLTAQLAQYGVDLSGNCNSTQIGDAASGLEEQIDSVSTQSTTSLDEMDLVSNDYENDAQATADFIQGMSETVQTAVSGLKTG